MSGKELLEKYVKGEMTYNQVIDHSVSLPYEEATRLFQALDFLVIFIGPKIAEALDEHEK